MARRYTRQSFRERLEAEIGRGRAIVMTGAGNGISAKFIERGGVDIIGVYNTGYFRMQGYGSLVCRIYRNFPRVAFFWMNAQSNRAQRHDFCGDDGAICREASRIPWKENWEATEAAYDRSAACRFTTFHAYEWTGGAGAGNNFHRNVVFANDVVPEIPLSFIDAASISRIPA